MRLFLLLSLLAAVTLALLSQPTATATGKSPAKAAKTVTMTEENLPQGKLYTITVPTGSGFEVRPVMGEALATVEGFARKNPKAVAIINAGYFDPSNGQTTSYITVDGKTVADPTRNERLTANDNIQPYLPRIFNRPVFALSRCEGKNPVYRLGYAKNWEKACCKMTSVGAGPMLYTENDAEKASADVVKANALADAFIDQNENGRWKRDPIGVFAKNARSAVGITRDGDILIMMGAQVPAENKKGFSLSDMADQMKAHGAVEALNLDGGSSSSIYYRGRAIYGRYDRNGVVKRPVKSVLMVLPQG